MQDIRDEACYNSDTDEIFIPFKDSNRLFNDVFQDCVQKLFYRNISEVKSYTNGNKINKTENFWGPARIDVTVVYQDKNNDEPQSQTEHIILNPEQVKPCSDSDQLDHLSKLSTDTTLIIIYSSAGFISIIIIISLIIFFRRKKPKKPKTGVDTNPEYGADYYYKQSEETYGGTVQYVT